MFSRRATWDLKINRIAQRIEERRASGLSFVDLTESNPTQCGLGWSPDEIAALLSEPRAADHVPSPNGSPEARAAISVYLATHQAVVSPERVLLTASTSESYSFLMKLLCDPEDTWLVPTPSYPLLDVLAQVESVDLIRYFLRYDGEWHLDRQTLERSITPRTRAVVVVHPGNPTGAPISENDFSFLSRLCADHQLALISDEVFFDTLLTSVPSAAAITECLTFQLSGLSKICGVPQIKAGWIAVTGPEALVISAIGRLEMIADAFLSVSASAQLALPTFLDKRESFLGRLRSRLETNQALLEKATPPTAPWSVLRAAGGWSSVIRVGETVDEETLCEALLDAGVAVQPGFFYDFERNGHLVVSRLPQPHEFTQGLDRMAEVLVSFS